MICVPVLLSVLLAASARPSVRLVAVEGNCRIPAATVRHYVSARPGAPCTEESMREDIRRLHALGVFREAEVLVRPAGEGRVDVVYRVRERPWVAGFAIESGSRAMDGRIRDFLRRNGLEPRPAAPYDPAQARRIETAVRRMLREDRHPQAEARILAEGGDKSVKVRLIVQAGPRRAPPRPKGESARFRLESLEAEGDAGAAGAEVRAILASVEVPRLCDDGFLESVRRKLGEALGRNGYALAQVHLLRSDGEGPASVRALFRIHAGDPVLTGRIVFVGNSRVPDRFLRRELRLAEGRVFNTQALDESLMALNRSGLIEEIARDDVRLEYDRESNTVDVIVHVRERGRQGIYATGGTGGYGGPYLGAIYRVFNLLNLGEIISLELDGGAAQSNFLLNFAASRFLGLPASFAFSAFHRVAGLNLGGIVPGASDVVALLRRRSAGFQLAGSYPVGAKSRVTIALGHERSAVEIRDPAGAGTVESPAAGRSGLTPGFVFDSTRGAGAALRGSRLAFDQSWTGGPLLAPLASLEHSFRLETYRNAPGSRGRNALAFRFRGDAVRPIGGRALATDRRLFPGGEVVRGMGGGALAAWAHDEGGVSLIPAGADAWMGFSTEYRVPLRGPWSGVGFFDLGWSRLSAGAEGALVRATSGLLRASAGGDLRLQLPAIETPARLIFAWNPLRLDTVIRSGDRALRLADPRAAVRFVLGDR